MNFSVKYPSSLVNKTSPFEAQSANEFQCSSFLQKSVSPVRKYQQVDGSIECPQSPYQAIKKVGPLLMDELQSFALPKSASTDVHVINNENRKTSVGCFESDKSLRDLSQKTPENKRKIRQQQGSYSVFPFSDKSSKVNLSPFEAEDRLYNRICLRNETKKVASFQPFESNHADNSVGDFEQALSVPIEHKCQISFKNHFLKSLEKQPNKIVKSVKSTRNLSINRCL